MPEASWGGQEDFAVPSFERATLAYHGTSLPDAAKIIIDGAPRAGVTLIANRPGIGVFTEEYKQDALGYATHILMPHHPEIAVAVILQLCVDRDKGTQVEPGLWSQPEGTVMVCGVYTHLLPIADLYGHQFHGRYRIHNSVYSTLNSVYVDEEGKAYYGEEPSVDTPDYSVDDDSGEDKENLPSNAAPSSPSAAGPQ
jgi:hypothetical protein